MVRNPERQTMPNRRMPWKRPDQLGFHLVVAPATQWQSRVCFPFERMHRTTNPYYLLVVFISLRRYVRALSATCGPFRLLLPQRNIPAFPNLSMFDRVCLTRKTHINENQKSHDGAHRAIVGLTSFCLVSEHDPPPPQLKCFSYIIRHFSSSTYRMRSLLIDVGISLVGAPGQKSECDK